jgi:hypothetical protein
VNVVAPARGEIAGDWDGTITADVALDGPGARIEHWDVTLEIDHRGRTLRYPGLTPATGGPGRYQFRLPEGAAGAAALQRLLGDMTPGEVLVASARVTRREGAEGFQQTLAFPFRLADARAVRLPLEPFFVLFEDPEYNRQLASPAKQAAGLVKATDDGQPALHTVTLSTDRTEYDPDGELALRYDWDDGTSPHRARLVIDLVDATGVPRPLELRVGSARQRMITVSAGGLRQLALRDLVDRGAPVRLAAGQSLALTLTIAAGPRGVLERADIVLVVNVATAAVTPAPQAAYALLRRQVVDGRTQVECVRFAWSPRATRVELVCPDDLRTQVVRRRAVFLWTDTARTGTATGYAVQKITRTGSTHFPTPDVIERVT